MFRISESLKITSAAEKKIQSFPASRISPTKIIVFGYVAIIAIGTLLLMLPISTRVGIVTPLVDALFTATSATCVTGLVVFDTYTYWSLFGQIVILALIQVGGIGFMTLSIVSVMFMRRKIGLRHRFMMQESVSAPQVGGIVKMARFIFFGTILIEGIGAVLLSFRLCPQNGFLKGLYFSLFYAVSAFCNAGFDLMGHVQPFSSLTSVASDPLFNGVVMALVVIGGLGFYVWADIVENKTKFRRYKLNSKLVLVTSGILLFGGAVLFALLEWNGEAFAGASAWEKCLYSLFQSVTVRTAGFNTVDLSQFSDGGILLSCALMLIGGSPGSTAGGIKTTTFAVLFLTILSELKNKKEVECFRRRIGGEVLKQACSIFMLYLSVVLAAALAISSIDGIGLRAVLFETVSAIGTVGLSLGATPGLSVWSHLILIVMMFFGRVGGLTMLVVFSDLYDSSPSRLPLERITVG